MGRTRDMVLGTLKFVDSVFLFKCCLNDFTDGEGKHYMPHLIKIPVKKCWGRERECAETGNDAGAAAEGRPALLLPSLNTEMFHPPHLIHF